jgi:hypothetical protein
MSKGPGRIQRAIKALFEAEPDNAFTTTELCERVYGVKDTGKRHRIAVIRAAKTIPGLDHWAGENLGKQLVFYDPLNVMSYAMARLKSGFLENYRNADPRCPPHWKTDTEADLRAKLGNDEYRKLICEGGSWWLHTEISRAKARGDQKRAAQLQAQADENWEVILSGLTSKLQSLKLPEKNPK